MSVMITTTMMMLIKAKTALHEKLSYDIIG